MKLRFFLRRFAVIVFLVIMAAVFFKAGEAITATSGSIVDAGSYQGFSILSVAFALAALIDTSVECLKRR